MLLKTVLIGAFCAFALGAPAQAQSADPGGIVLVGLDGRTHTITRADVAEAPRVRISLNAHGQVHVFEGAPLTHFLAAAGAPTGPALQREALRDVVIVSARDDYAVVLALADTDPTMRADPIIIADMMDGVPISAAEQGPFRLVIQGDLRLPRSVRMVSRIELRQLQPSR